MENTSLIQAVAAILKQRGENVPAELLDTKGPVDPDVALALAKGTREMHSAFITRIPFLTELPADIQARLDDSEWLLPEDDVADIRLALEQKLDCYIMTYKRGTLDLHIHLDQHLCANVQGASLDTHDLALLQASEVLLSMHNVSFVAYAKPLKCIDPTLSPMARFYK